MHICSVFLPPADYDPRTGPGMSVTAHFEMGGIRGKICFDQADFGSPVVITVELDGLKSQYAPQRFDWQILEYPVPFSKYPDFPCSDLGDTYEPFPCEPDQIDTPPCCGNLGQRLGLLRATSKPQVFTDDDLNLFGAFSPIGRSIVLRDTVREGIPIACANIEYQGISLQTLRAGFSGPELNGDVIFRRQNGRAGTTFHVDLYSACNHTLLDGSDLNWSLRTGTCDNIGGVSKILSVHSYI